MEFFLCNFKHSGERMERKNLLFMQIVTIWVKNDVQAAQNP
jgi:hypothetical protein